MNEQQNELIELLRSEVEALVEDAGSLSETQDSSSLKEHLQLYSERAESIGNAAQLVGLQGLSDVCAVLAGNFVELAERDSISEPQQLLLESWAFFLLSYLQFFDNEEELAATAEELVAFLSEEAWPVPCDEAAAALIRESLLSTDIIVCESDENALPAEADAGMVSLALAPDIKIELLEGLLIELPGQAAQFSSSLQQYLKTRQQEQLRIAMRVAHTVKGAANVVNVAGVANLMHISEDILELLDKHAAAPPQPLLQLLLETADCLESMVETLVDGAPEPAEALSVMQNLLHWVHTLREQGIPSEESCAELPWLQKAEPSSRTEEPLYAPPPACQDDTESTSLVEQGAPEQEVSEPESTEPDTPAPNQEFVRIDASLIDDLIRMNGDDSISTTVQESQLITMQQRLALTAEYQQRIRQMADELQQLIEVKGVINRNRYCYSSDTGSTNSDADQLDPLELEHYNELHSFSSRLQEVVVDAREELQQAQADLRQLKNIVHEKKTRNRDTQGILLSTRMVAFGTLSNRLHRCVRQAARSLNKPVELIIEGEETMIDQGMLKQISDPIMHLLRNAVDHGIEPEQRRIDHHKAPQGEIRLAVRRTAESIEITCRDDGGGLDNAAVVSTAVERGLLNAEQAKSALEQGDVACLILLPGFSTRLTASHLSGRGVGLDIVHSEVLALHGTLSVDSEADLGTCFTLTLPTSQHTGQVLLTRIEGQSVALLASGVEQIIHLDENDRKQFAATATDTHSGIYQRNEENVELKTLEQLITINGSALEAATPHVLLLLKPSGGSRSGILLESLSHCQDLVIKPFNAFSFRPAGVMGGVVLGDGSVAPVLDLPSLLAAENDNKYQRTYQKTKHIELPLALVVDDSLSVRRSLKQLVGDMGLEVRTARDGLEAIGVIAEKIPDIMLVDLEMPRMNGLELTAHLRASTDTRNIPVIMITSRSTDKHRRLAAEAGVSTFVTKPFSDDDLSETIQREIAC